MQKKIELALKILIALTFFVPLVFLPKDFIFPFIVPKIITFRSLTLVLLGLYLALASSDWERYKIRNSPITIIVALFLLSFGLSTFLGQDWYRSFWDNHERMLGFFTVAHYVIYYFIVTSVISKWADWKWLLRAFLFAGGIVMFIALIQQFDNDFLLNTSGNRSAATLGNAIYVGGYALFLFFIGWLMVMKEKNNLWKGFAGIIGVLSFFGVFFSGSRGAFLGLFVGIGILSISYLITLKEEHRKIKIVLGSIIAIGILSMIILFQFRGNAFINNIPTIGRFINTPFLNFTETTRGMAWGIALEGWKERPIIGWGPGNYYYAFNKYYRPEFLRFGYGETWFDNAHNIVLNTFTERGLVGVFFYLSLFGASILMLWRNYKNNSLDLHLVSVGTAFFIAHLAQTMTVFENPTSYLYFFFFLAFINSQTFFTRERHKKEDSPKSSVSVPVMAISGLAISLLIYSTNINVARANMATLNVIRGVYVLQDITPLYEIAINIPSPHIDDIRNDAARTVSSNLRKYVQAGKGELAKDLFKLVYAELAKNRELHPLDLRVHAQQSLLAQEAATLSQNRLLLVEAEKVMDDAMPKSPKRQQFIYTMAGIKIQLQKYGEAEALYKGAIEDDELIGESWWRLALLYSVTGKMEESVKLIEEAREKNINFGAEGDQVVARILGKLDESTEDSDTEG